MSVLDSESQRESFRNFAILLVFLVWCPVYFFFLLPRLPDPSSDVVVFLYLVPIAVVPWLVAEALTRVLRQRRTRSSSVTFATQADAKRFIVAKILEQAEREGVNLSIAQRHMLSWSESDPDFAPEYALAATADDEIPQAELEKKIAGLIRRAYDQDCATDASARSRYREAHAKLCEGDHYIVIAMEQAI